MVWKQETGEGERERARRRMREGLMKIERHKGCNVKESREDTEREHAEVAASRNEGGRNSSTSIPYFEAQSLIKWEKSAFRLRQCDDLLSRVVIQHSVRHSMWLVVTP